MATITKNKYLLLFFVLLTILTKANCADKASLSQQLIITPGLHHKRIVDIRLSYENPRKNYLLSYEDIEGNYKISLKLFIERWDSKNVISEDTLCNPKVFSGEIKRGWRHLHIILLME